MRIKYFILSAIILAVVAVSGVLLYSYWPAITGTINNSKYYTSEDLQNSYDDGFEDGCNNYNELTTQVDYYKELTDVYYLQILELQDTVKTLETTNKNNTQTIVDLEAQKQTLETDVENLQSIKTENEETITNLNLQITSLQTRVDELTADKIANQNEIVSLKNQIANLQTLNTQLQRTNELNAETITSLNNQIANLNSQISEMNAQVSNNSSVVNTLNNRISELEKTVSYYEQYIANLENGEQVVATFEFDGSVYNIQIVNKNDYAGVVTPTSTNYVKFNYWTVNGEQVDLTTYALTTNTTFVANVSYYYDVKFMIDTEVFNSQIVEKDTFAVLPEAPTKDGYAFDGWTSNGIDIVDVTSIAITQNTTFTAKFTKIHNVTFIYEDSTLATQTIKNGEYAQSVEVENTDYKKFNGWLLNGTIVDLTSYKITADTILTASVTYSYDVTFIVDDTVYSTQIVETGKYVSVPTVPTKDGYVFDGWSINGIDIVDLTINSVNSNIVYYALFSLDNAGYYSLDGEKLYSWSDLTSNGYITATSTTVSGVSSDFKALEAGKLVLPDKITTLNKSAFYGSRNIKEIELSNSLVRINDQALQSTGIKTIVIPSSVTYIGTYAFNGCSYLHSIYIENASNLTLYADSSFFVGMSNFLIMISDSSIPSNWNSNWNKFWSSYKANYRLNVSYEDYLDEISDGYIIENNTLIRYFGSEEIFTIPENVSNIGIYAFGGNSTLTNVLLHDSIIEFSSYSFASCSSLTSIILPSSLKNIGAYTFHSCSNLASIFIPSSVEELGQGAFYDCSVLENVTFSNDCKITSFENYLFSGCKLLEKIIVPNSVTDIGINCFYTIKHILLGTGIQYLTFDISKYVETIFIPTSVKTISANNASQSPFYGCSSIKIYCQASSKPSGFSSYWNYIDSSKTASVTYNYTVAKYLELIGA